MSFLFPFVSLNDIQLHEELFNNDCKFIVNNRLSDHGLKDFISVLSKDELFKSLNSAYYSFEQFNEKINVIGKSVELGVFHLNIHSLNSKVNQFCMLMDSIGLDFDVIVLSEIWTTNIEFYRNILKGYSLHTDLPVCGHVGGVGVFIKRSLSAYIRNDLKLPVSDKNKVENIWFEIVKNNKKYIVGGIYRHPNQNIIEFNDLLENNLNKLSSEKMPCLILGDVNVDILKFNDNTGTKAYLNNLVLHNFLPILLLPTRVTDHSCTLIDHIYYHEGQRSRNAVQLTSGNLFSDISDHLPNFVLLVKTASKINYKERPFIRLFTPKNKEKFNRALSDINWNVVFNGSNDVNDCYNKFIALLKLNYENCFPLTQMSRRAYRDKPWITPALKISSKHKNALYKKWISSGNKQDENVYKMYKKVYNKIANKAEITFYNKQFDVKINSTRQIWSNLNRVMSVNKKDKNACCINKLVVNNQDLCAPLDISNALNEYFCSIGSNLSSKLPNTTAQYSDYLCSPLSTSLFVEPVTALEIDSMISSLKCDKSCGDDGIGPQLIKDNKNLLCEPLVYLYNLSLFNGVVPDKLKTAKVVPLFKKGDRCRMENYRPISLLSIFNKILEKLVYKRVYHFLDKKGVLYKYQFGFRKKFSTSLALLEVMDYCYKNIDDGNKVLGIFFDLQKAFDTVDHNILLCKMYNYGIRGLMYNWFKNYLHDRKQYTVVNSAASRFGNITGNDLVNSVASRLGNVTCGVPQGSVLGPLLFLIYVNDISNVIDEYDLKLFADDTNLFMAGRSLYELEVKANLCLDKLQVWFLANKLSLNIEKTCYTLFSSKSDKNCYSMNLLIGGQTIMKVSSCKYLGVFVDEKLLWDVHINYIYNKLVKFSSIFYKTRHLLPLACLKKLYFAFVFPHILFGIEVYANTNKVRLEKLSKLNNKLIRILLNKKLSTPVLELYKLMNVLPIKQLHEMQLLQFVHKCMYHKGLLPDIFHNYFAYMHSVHCHNTRSNCDLFLSRAKSNLGQRCCVYKCSQLWNFLPVVIKSNSSLSIFKKDVKKYLFDCLIV